MKDVTLQVFVKEVFNLTEELSAIQKLRYQVYSQEMGLGLPGVDHAHCVLTDPMDAPAIHISAKIGCELAGSVRLNVNMVPRGLEQALQVESLPKPFVYCSRLCVLDPFRGRGIVQRLSRTCFLQFDEMAASAAVCHCYPHLLELYRRMGFQPYGTRFMLPGLEHLGYQIPLRCMLKAGKADQAA